jgi:thiazole/oxazole-forming peptide maturase SagD family component
MSTGPLQSLSREWTLDLQAGGACLSRPSDGAAIELEGLDRQMLLHLWSVLANPMAGEALERAFASLGDGASDVREIFAAEGVIRGCHGGDPPAFRAYGSSPPLADLLDRRLWRFSAVAYVADDHLTHCLSGGVRAEVVLIAIGDGVVATRNGCASCLALRGLAVLAREGEGGPTKPATASAKSSRPDDDLRLALVARALSLLEDENLGPDRAVLVRRDDGASCGPLLPHPDCPSCGARPDPRRAPQWLKDDLASTRGGSSSAEDIERVFGAGPLAPLVVRERTGDESSFVFGLPFLSGDTRLVRAEPPRCAQTSIESIAHGSSSTLERSRLLTWSEGVERIQAQSAVPDVRLRGDEPDVIADGARYGWNPPGSSGDRPYCRGLDLLRGTSCLVPFERVVVRAPPFLLDPDAPPELTFTGVASHVTAIESVLHGTVELLKRDAFMIMWYRKRRLRRLGWPASLPEGAAARARYLTERGLDLELYDLRTDLPLPVVLLWARARRTIGNWPAGGSLLVPGGGFDPEEALGHALSLACTRFAGIALDTHAERDVLNPGAVARLSRSVLGWEGIVRYLDPARSASLDFIRGGDVRSVEDLRAGAPLGPRQRFEAMQSWLRDAKMNWIAVSLNDFNTEAAGLRVTRSLVPEAVRLTLGRSGVDALRARLARPWPNAEEGSWNVDPHPLY